MTHVDALSRAPVEENTGESKPTGQIRFIETREDEILLFQRNDPEIKIIIDSLKKGEKERNREEKQLCHGFQLKEGFLFKKIKLGDKVKELYYVPKAMRKSIAIRYHDLHSHFGLDKTFNRIKEFYYFPKMRQYLKTHIKNCLECILAKKKTGRKEGELHPIPPGRRPFEIIHCDHLGPFPTSTKKNKYVLGIIDNLTKFAWLAPVSNVDAKSTVNKIEKFVNRFGAPRRIISDRGTCFTSELYQKFCLEYGILHTLNSSRHPQANGLIERLNRTVLPIIKIAAENENDNRWDKNLDKISRDLNSSVSKSTGKTPYEALMGYNPRFKEGGLRKLIAQNESYVLPEIVQKEIRENIVLEQNKYKNRYDLNKNVKLKLKIRDIVYMKRNPISTGSSTKLQMFYGGPLLIVNKISNDTYRVKKLNDYKDCGLYIYIISIISLRTN